MMIKGGIRIGGLSKIGGLDADAVAYFERAGVTDATAKSQISAFVVGVKALGLYNNMVSWPLRSAQNKGSGSIGYSLGGLQTANATLVNGSTWTANGTPFTTTQYANATISDPGQDLTLLLVAAGSGVNYSTFPQFFGVQSPTTFVNNQFTMGDGFGNAGAIGALHGNSASFQNSGNIASGLSGSTSFRFLSASTKISTVLNIKRLDIPDEASGTPVSAGTATLTRMQLNGRWTGTQALGVEMTCAFCAVIAPNINSTESSIYSLYKTTMGTGLGLP
jgi:hypothetical protein